MNGVVPFGFYVLKLNTGWTKKIRRGGEGRVRVGITMFGSMRIDFIGSPGMLIGL